MFRRGGFLRFLLILAMLGVLVAGGAGLYRAGWMQGYQAAALTAAAPTAGQSGSQAAPASPYYYGPWMYGPHFWGPGFGFFPFFPFFGIGFFILMLFVFGGLFRLIAFRRWAGGPHHWSEEDERAWKERHGNREDQGDDKPAE